MYSVNVHLTNNAFMPTSTLGYLRRVLKQLAILLLACTAMACAKPNAALPTVTQAELAQEAARQKQMAHGVVTMDYAGEVRYSKQEKIAMQEQLQRVTTRLVPEATTLCFELSGYTRNCDMHIELSSTEKGLNAHADGEKIVINAHMVDFTRNEDDQLAFVLAHEYVHHMMGHVASAKQNVLIGALAGMAIDVAAASQGASTNGQFANMGAKAGMLQYSPSFEQEADYIALYMLARAGFNIEKAPDFWRRMAQYNPKGIYNRTTHPTTPERFVLMNKVVSEIKHKQQTGQALRPNLLPKSSLNHSPVILPEGSMTISDASTGEMTHG